MMATASDVSRALARALIRTAVWFLPSGRRDRYRAEWLAALDELEREEIPAFIPAFRMFINAPQVGHVLRAGERSQGTGERLTTPAWHMAAKRAIDIVAGAVLLPLAAPVLLLAAIAIRLEDGGPVLYRHLVIGRYGVQTEVLKLRTVVPDAFKMLDGLAAMNERKGGPPFKASNDPRVTRIGRILRATSIDELPQFWDVLTGQMSLVGPRFPLPKEAVQFDEELQRRTVMRPGITGLWQTEARDNPSFSAYRRLDLLYADNWSLGLDLAILANAAHRAMRALFSRAT